MKKTIIGILVAVLLLSVTVYAHGRNYPIHEEIEEILESGTFQDLEQLRQDYNMPIMHWIESEEDFALVQENHERSELTPQRFGGCHW